MTWQFSSNAGGEDFGYFAPREKRVQSRLRSIVPWNWPGRLVRRGWRDLREKGFSAKNQDGAVGARQPHKAGGRGRNSPSRDQIWESPSLVTEWVCKTCAFGHAAFNSLDSYHAGIAGGKARSASPATRIRFPLLAPVGRRSNCGQCGRLTSDGTLFDLELGHRPMGIAPGRS
jgi:hypothetical protein